MEPDWKETGAKQSVIWLQAAQTALEKPTLCCEMAVLESIPLSAYLGSLPSHGERLLQTKLLLYRR